MAEAGQSDYMKICSCYRVFSIILATLVYFIFAVQADELNMKKVLVAGGMLSACFLGIILYHKILGQKIKTVWMYVIVLVEVFAYGIFIYVSGGFYSPFLWYCIGCLFLPMSLNKCRPIVFIATGWYLLCTIANRLMRGSQIQPINLEVNTGIGVMIVISAFYILVNYIRRLNQIQQETEQALSHITDLYDSFHLFTMSDIDKIMGQLAGIIRRTVAPDGSLLIKFNEDGVPEWHQSMGMADDVMGSIENWENVISYKDSRLKIDIGCKRYDAVQIGTSPVFSGMLIMPEREYYAGESKTDGFYYSLIDIVFKNIDVQKQLEEYIAKEEQKRIADEIHDTVIQKLFGIACRMKVLEMELAAGREIALKEEFVSLRDSVELTMKELRETIYGERFSENEKQFREKLKSYMDEVEKLWDAQITLKMDKEAETLPVSHKLAIYKTVCEAVNNAVRHGTAKAIEISLEIDEAGINTFISDNGTGFIAGEKKSGIREGNGLKNMQRLAKAFKGTCLVASKPGAGTQVKLYLPR